MHPCCRPAHHVGVGRVPVVHRSGSPTGFACVGIVNVAPVQETVVPIFVPLERGGRTLVLCARSAETIPGWLLVATAVTTSASASASPSAVVGRAGGVNPGTPAYVGYLCIILRCQKHTSRYICIIPLLVKLAYFLPPKKLCVSDFVPEST